MNKAQKERLRKLENNLIRDNIPAYEYLVVFGHRTGKPMLTKDPQSINHARRAKKYAQTHQLPLNAGMALYDLHVRQAAAQRNLKETEELAHTK